MYGRDTCPPVGTMTDDEKEKEIVRRSMNGLLRAVRHFEGSKHLQCGKSKDLTYLQASQKRAEGAKFFVDVWSKKEFQKLIERLRRKHCGVKPVQEKPEEKEEETRLEKAEFRK